MKRLLALALIAPLLATAAARGDDLAGTWKISSLTANVKGAVELTAWVLKVCLLRYGGMRLYRTAVPFFIGLILGDIATQTTWSLVTSILDVPVYQFL